MGAADNKTLRTKCSGCGSEIPTDVDADVKERKTWSLIGATDGAKQVYPVCTKCYNEGWRPPGYTG